jgi:hypothetical protein
MKTVVAVLVALSLGWTVAAQTSPAKKSPSARPGAEKADAKKEEPPKIEGIEIVRGGDRGFLGIQIVNANFKLTFYGKDRKPTAPDVARAVLRWDPKYKVGDDRIVLNPAADGTSLSAPRSIRAPYNFKLFITLFKDATDGASSPVGENYVIDFRQ